MQNQLITKQKLLSILESKLLHLYADSPDEDGCSRFVQILQAYRQEVERRLEGRSLDSTSDSSLRTTIRQAGDLMHEMVADYPNEMRGWYHGAEAENRTQRLYQVLSDCVLDMSWAVVSIPTVTAVKTNDIVTH